MKECKTGLIEIADDIYSDLLLCIDCENVSCSIQHFIGIVRERMEQKQGCVKREPKKPKNPIGR